MRGPTGSKASIYITTQSRIMNWTTQSGAKSKKTTNVLARVGYKEWLKAMVEKPRGFCHPIKIMDHNMQEGV